MRTSGKTYQWREGHSHSVPASVAAEVIERLQVDEPAKPKALVEVSRPDDAPLHGEFTWDDEVAGQKWREDEARRVIRGYYVVHEDAGAEPKMIIANVSIMSDDGERGYVNTEVALSHEETREQVLRDALAQLEAWKRRFSHFTDAANQIALAMETIRDEIDAVSKQPEPKRPAPKAKYRDPKPRRKAVPVAAL